MEDIESAARLPPIKRLNMTSGDKRKREGECKLRIEEEEKWTQRKALMKLLEAAEKKSNMEHLENDYLWGKTQSLPRISLAKTSPPTEEWFFDRTPGSGAPYKTGSGRVRAARRVDPAIHFHTNGGSNEILNVVRYKNGEQESYRKELDRHIAAKKERRDREAKEEKEKLQEMELFYPFDKLHPLEPIKSTRSCGNVANLNENSDTFWGKSKAAKEERDRAKGSKKTDSASLGSLLLPSAVGKPFASASCFKICKNDLHPENNFGFHLQDQCSQRRAHIPGKKSTGVLFMEMMGYPLSDEPEKRLSGEAKREYLDSLKKDMGLKLEERYKEKRALEGGGGQGQDLVSLMRATSVGRPKYDPTTGQLLRQSHSTSDVVSDRLGLRHESQELRHELQQFMNRDREMKEIMKKRQREKEIEADQLHILTWNNVFGPRRARSVRKGKNSNEKEYALETRCPQTALPRAAT